MKPRKQKANEPPLRKFLAAFEADVADNAVEVIKQLREKSPEKYSEIAAKLLSAIQQQPDPDGFDSANSMQELGLRLLRSIGVEESAITDDMITQAVQANEEFIRTLEAIRDRAQADYN
jgi:hypothetical protein